MKRNIINRMTRKPETEGYSRGMYRTHIQLDQYELNDRLKMTKKKEVSLFFESQYNKNLSKTSLMFNESDFKRFDNLIYFFLFLDNLVSKLEPLCLKIFIILVINDNFVNTFNNSIPEILSRSEM